MVSKLDETDGDRQMQALITETAALIAKYDPQWAQKFVNEPFRRVEIATAFANGFLNGRPADSDPHPHALLVVEVALLDRRARRLAA